MHGHFQNDVHGHLGDTEATPVPLLHRRERRGDSERIRQQSVRVEFLGRVGYVGDIKLITASEYGARTVRKRAWIVAFNLELCGLSAPEALTLVGRVFSLVDKLKVEVPVDLDRFILPDGHPWLLREFQRLTALRAEQPAPQSGSSLVSLCLHRFPW